MDNRKFCASFSVRMDTTRIRFELSPAPIHGGPEGTFRVRMDRRWLDTEDGKPRFFDRTALTALLLDAALGTVADPPPAPQLCNKMRVRVPLKCLGDMQCYESTWTHSPPILAYDGRWMIAVYQFGKGVVFVPCDDILPVKNRMETLYEQE